MIVILLAMNIRLAILLMRLIMIPPTLAMLSVLPMSFLITIVFALVILAIPQVLLIMILMRGALTHIFPIVEAIVNINTSIASITGNLHFHCALHALINTSNDIMEFTFISTVMMMMYLLPEFRFQLIMIELILKMFKFDYIIQWSSHLPNQLAIFLMHYMILF